MHDGMQESSYHLEEFCLARFAQWLQSLNVMLFSIKVRLLNLRILLKI